MTQAVEGRNASTSGNKRAVYRCCRDHDARCGYQGQKITSSHVPPVFRPHLRVAGARRSNTRPPLQTETSRRRRKQLPSCAPWPCCFSRSPSFGRPKLGTAPPRALAWSAGCSWPYSHSSRWCQFYSSSRASKNVSVRAFLTPVLCSGGLEPEQQSTQHKCMGTFKPVLAVVKHRQQVVEV